MVENSLWQRAALVLSVFSLFVLFAPQQVIAAGPPADITNLASSTHSPPETVKNTANITFTWTVPTDATGDPGTTNVAGYSYVISTSATATVDIDTESNDDSFSSVQVTASPDGNTWYFRIMAIGTDGTRGNVATSGPYNIDTTAPASASSVSVSPGNANNAISWTPPSTDYVGTKIRFSTTAYPTSNTDGTPVIDRTSDTAGQAATYTHSNLTNGDTYYYSIYVYDQAGNYSTASQVSGKPNASGWTTSLSIDGGAAYSNSATAAVSLAIVGNSDTGAADGMQFSTDDSTWTSGASGAAAGTVLAYSTTNNYTFADTSDGTKTLYVRFAANCTNAITGNAGTLTAASCDTPSSSTNDAIVIDTTIPTGSITVPATSTSKAIALTLSGADTNGVSTMEIAEDINFVVNSTGATAYNTTANYTLDRAVNGRSYPIFVRYTDGAGNVSTVSTGTVTYTGITAPEDIPTLSEWGMIIFVSLLLGSALFQFYRRREQMR